MLNHSKVKKEGSQKQTNLLVRAFWFRCRISWGLPVCRTRNCPFWKALHFFCPLFFQGIVGVLKKFAHFPYFCLGEASAGNAVANFSWHTALKQILEVLKENPSIVKMPAVLVQNRGSDQSQSGGMAVLGSILGYNNVTNMLQDLQNQLARNPSEKEKQLQK